METTFFSACAAASFEEGVSIIETLLPFNVVNKFWNAFDGKNDAAAEPIRAVTTTVGINQPLILLQAITFLAGPVVFLATAFFSSFGA